MYVAHALNAGQDPYKGDQEVYSWTECLVELAKSLNNKCSLLRYNSAYSVLLLKQVQLEEAELVTEVHACT